jgi:hypothetical protein
VRQAKQQSDAQLSVGTGALQLPTAAASGKASPSVIGTTILDDTFKKEGTH